MALPNDTSPEAEAVLIEVFRRLTPATKWRQLGQMYRDARALHAMGMRYFNPTISPREITEAWIETTLGIHLPFQLPDHVWSPSMHTLTEFTEVARILDQTGIVYVLGGSMASSLFGVSRHTNDADVMVEPFPGKERELIEALGPDYYLSEVAIRQAHRAKSSFNLINTRTGFKVDVFIRAEGAFEQSAMARRIRLGVEDPSAPPISVLSPEDIVLFKLRWYRLGNEVSEQQWKDLVNVLKVRRASLDRSYLTQWGKALGVEDLLLRAWSEVEPPPQGQS